jgi:predicted negative regulator of RcsB-dependent stress response
MDERQQQGLREGAGLEESRLNTDFINFVQRWGGPFLLLCAALMAAWAGWNWWQRQQADRVDEAFAQYEAQIAGGNPSPEALKAVADEFEGVASVSLLARLDAADVYTASIRSGVKAGADLNPDGTLASPDDALTQEERDRLLEQAATLYQRVFDTASRATGKGVLAIRAAYGLAAVAETRGDIADARGHYERIIEIAEANSFTNHVELARARIEGLDALASPITMLSQADLPERPAPPQPELPTLPGMDEPAGPTIDPIAPNPFNPEGGDPLTPGLPGMELPDPNQPAPSEPTPADPLTPPDEPAPAPAGNEPAPTGNEPEPTPTEPDPQPAPTPPGR